MSIRQMFHFINNELLTALQHNTTCQKDIQYFIYCISWLSAHYIILYAAVVVVPSSFLLMTLKKIINRPNNHFTVHTTSTHVIRA